MLSIRRQPAEAAAAASSTADCYWCIYGTRALRRSPLARSFSTSHSLPLSCSFSLTQRSHATVWCACMYIVYVCVLLCMCLRCVAVHRHLSGASAFPYAKCTHTFHMHINMSRRQLTFVVSCPLCRWSCRLSRSLVSLSHRGVFRSVPHQHDRYIAQRQAGKQAGGRLVVCEPPMYVLGVLVRSTTPVALVYVYMARPCVCVSGAVRALPFFYSSVHRECAMVVCGLWFFVLSFSIMLTFLDRISFVCCSFFRCFVVVGFFNAVWCIIHLSYMGISFVILYFLVVLFFFFLYNSRCCSLPLSVTVCVCVSSLLSVVHVHSIERSCHIGSEHYTFEIANWPILAGNTADETPKDPVENVVSWRL